MHLFYVNVFTLASCCPASQETNTSSIGLCGKMEFGHITRLRTGDILRFENITHNLFPVVFLAGPPTFHGFRHRVWLRLFLRQR